MTTSQITKTAKNLKPSKNEITHFTAVRPNGMRSIFSVYQSNGFKVAEGMIFNERQNHKVVKSAKGYEPIINFLVSQCK